MSKAVNSPTARLLQNSRLFSLPRPLPAPLHESLTSTGLYRASDTATLAYPTHQAITTPASSLHRGDFGLKRPLPGRRTRNTSTPHIRVQAQDTFEHITDFASAADHTQTEAKWAQMGVPILRKPEARRERFEEKQSVYEGWSDNTDPHARGAATRAEAKQMQRWKFDGPWIAGMQEGEFDMYVQRKIDGRKGEWREFLREREAEARVRQRQRRAREEGEPLSASDVQALRVQLRPTDDELTSIEKRLRDEHPGEALSSNLTSLISDFLDLPGLYSNPDHAPIAARSIRNEGLRKAITNETSLDRGPPTTHPGAGLSHLRTNAIMHNHPLYGPQAHPTPIEARVIRPRTSASGGTEYQAKLGIGGVVASDPKSATSPGNPRDRMNDTDRMVQQLDPDLKGGNKIWVHAESAFIHENGRIRLEVTRAEDEALAVMKGGEELERLHRVKRASSGAVAQASAAGASAPRPRVEGFDRVLRAGQADTRNARTAEQQMQDLWEKGR